MFGIDAFWIVLTGALVGGSCALLGSFLVLRQMAMLGDAISHAVLPGIVIAFLITGSRGSLVMFIGAVALGLFTTFLIQFLSGKGVQGDAAIGVAFTFLFAVGVVLVSLYGHEIDLDLECVLYGEIAYAPFDTLMIGDLDLGPRPVWINGLLLLVNAGLVALFYKQFKLSAFDPGMAAAVGINVTLFHYLLMLMVSVTTVGAFESVGAILVVAMIIVPAAAAYLLTDHLHRMLLYAVAIGMGSSVFGYLLAVYLDASIAGAIAVVAGIIFLLAFLFSPTHGVFSKMLARQQMRLQVLGEDALLWLWRQSERVPTGAFSARAMAEAQNIAESEARGGLDRLVRAGAVDRSAIGFALNDTGRQQARDLIRRHRLFESYLGDIGYPADHTHNPADRVEHYLSEDVAERITRKIGPVETDPQGKPVPPQS
jgi:manganese/zinc/iron transport system permease protein